MSVGENPALSASPFKSLVPKAKKHGSKPRCPTVVTHLVVGQEGIDACSIRILLLLHELRRR